MSTCSIAMAKQSSSSVSPWLLPFFIHCLASNPLSIFSSASSAEQRKVYIVYMGELPKGEISATTLHYDILEKVLVGSTITSKDALVYSYKRSFHGFAAKLTEDEMRKMKEMEGVVSVFPNKLNQLHTTRSWDYMGFPQKVKRAELESDVIIGMLDSGIWPEHKSFSDEGIGPVPSKWKGICQFSDNFTCNNKIIGARYYRSYGDIDELLDDSPRDTEGHGTHTASTAAGRLVPNANFHGVGLGTARGGVPAARIAVYKVCWSDYGCLDSDILAGFDDAIADGVDIISVSLGGSYAYEYWTDPIAIGAFHAMKNGILTSNSAGNSGPGPSTVENVAPWSLIVAANTIDRQFVSKIKLGNGKVFEGVAINTFDLEDQMYPLVYGGDVPKTGLDGSYSRFCRIDSLDSTLVKGKIVLCDELSNGLGPYLANATGTIMQDGTWNDIAMTYVLPATCVGLDDGGKVAKYINGTSDPIATILKTNEAKNARAPYVISFSSRGPNPITPNILKPDITAPGVAILAAWSSAGDKTVPFYIVSGTSMSCPHATAAAAYVKSFYPTWSPAAIKSALMTSAYLMSNVSNTDAEFAYGAGHINPLGAVKPGLVYDAGENDYVRMLCGQGYDTELLRLVTGDKSSCSSTNNGTATDLNYPSFALSVHIGESFVQRFHRTLTNVGSPGSTYHASLSYPSGLKVSVVPNILTFKSIGEKRSFAVKVKGTTNSTVTSASLVWTDGVHHVRSPIAVYAQ